MSFIDIKKEDVYIDVKSQEEADEIVAILEQAGEPHDFGRFPYKEGTHYLVYGQYTTNPEDTPDWWFAIHQEQRTAPISIPQLAKALGVECPLKPKFEKGKWYKRTDGAIFRFNGEFDRDGCPHGYGVVGASWLDQHKLGWGWDVGDGFGEATKEEVERALVEVAKHKYRPGDKVSRLGGYYYYTNSTDTLKDSKFSCNDSEIDRIIVSARTTNGGYHAVFLNGKWAEVLGHLIPETECALEDKSLRQLLNEVSLEEVPVTFPCWVEGQVTLTAYRAPHSSTLYTTAKEARQAYIIHVIQDLL